MPQNANSVSFADGPEQDNDSIELLPHNNDSLDEQIETLDIIEPASPSPSSLESSSPLPDVAPLQSEKERKRDMIRAFLPLGFILIGGPSAHLTILHDIFVRRKKWISEALYIELLGLVQAIPGPTSTQLTTTIGALRGGVPGGLMALFCFQLPGFLMMMIAGLGSRSFSEQHLPDWAAGLLSGLSSAATTQIAVAAWRLGSKVCCDKFTKFICALSAAWTILYRAWWTFPFTLIVAGGSALMKPRVEAWIERKRIRKSSPPSDSPPVLETKPLDLKSDETDELAKTGVSKRAAIILFSLVIIIFVLLEIAVLSRPRPAKSSVSILTYIEIFFRLGTLIVGGGNIVVAMLLHELVESGMMSAQDFFSGLALIQIMPGPMFNFSAYCGAVIDGFRGSLFCFLALFYPGISFIFASYPAWRVVRSKPTTQIILKGVNAAALGVICAAFLLLWEKVTKGIAAFQAIGIIALSASLVMDLSAPKVIAGGGVLGIIAGAFGGRGNMGSNG